MTSQHVLVNTIVCLVVFFCTLLGLIFLFVNPIDCKVWTITAKKRSGQTLPDFSRDFFFRINLFSHPLYSLLHWEFFPIDYNFFLLNSLTSLVLRFITLNVQWFEKFLIPPICRKFDKLFSKYKPHLSRIIAGNYIGVTVLASLVERTFRTNTAQLYLS